MSACAKVGRARLTQPRDAGRFAACCSRSVAVPQLPFLHGNGCGRVCQPSGIGAFGARRPWLLREVAACRRERGRSIDPSSLSTGVLLPKACRTRAASGASRGLRSLRLRCARATRCAASGAGHVFIGSDPWSRSDDRSPTIDGGLTASRRTLCCQAQSRSDRFSPRDVISDTGRRGGGVIEPIDDGSTVGSAHAGRTVR